MKCNVFVVFIFVFTLLTKVEQNKLKTILFLKTLSLLHTNKNCDSIIHNNRPITSVISFSPVLQQLGSQPCLLLVVVAESAVQPQ